MAEGEIGLRASLKDRVQTARGLREVKDGVTGVGRSAEEAGAKARLGAGGFDTMRKAGRLAGLAIKTAFAGALAAGFAGYEFLKSSIEIARESQKIQRLTAQTIKTTGHAANVTAGQVKRYSEVMSVKTGIDRESIQTGENVLLMFRNVRNEVGKGNDIYKRATQAALDLSATPLFKGNVTTASKMVGKLLDDPVKNINALSRAGVQFSAYQIDQIKHMVAQNDLLGAQQLILRHINNVAGGAAAAQATWGDKAHQMWHNIEDEIGTALLPLLDRVERWFVQKGGKAIEKYSKVGVDYLIKIVDKLGDVEKKAMPLAKQVFPAVKTTLGDVYDVAKKLLPVVTKTVGAFNRMPSWAQKVVVGAGVAGYASYKTGLLGKATSALLGGGKGGGLVSRASPVPVFVTNEGFGGTGGGGLGKTVLKDGEKAAPFAAGTLGGAALGVAGLAAVVGGVGYLAYRIATAREDPTAVRAEAKRRADLTASRASTVGMIKPASNYDFNTLLQHQKAANEYQFNFNNELQQTHKELFGISKTKVTPTFTTPGLPLARRGADDYGAQLLKVGKPVITKVTADTGPATRAVDAFYNHVVDRLTASSNLLVHLAGVAMGGGPAPVSTPSSSAPSSSGASSGSHHHQSPQVPTGSRGRTTADSVPVPVMRIEQHVYLDGREIKASVVSNLKRDLANR